MHRRLFLERTDQFVCVAADAARRAESALGLPAGSVAYVRGGVDLYRFRPGLDGSALRSELGIPMDAPVAGIVARMRAARGLRWLTQAIPAVLEQVPSAHFLVAGRGELKHWFKREIRDPAYRGQVKYAGYRREDLPLSYAAMDVSLFLGLGSEGTCRALLEAMACARPTIGAHKAAVPEIIDNERTGLLVRDHDVKDLSDKLVEMLGDRDKCARMGEAARARAETLFDEAARARAFDAIYRSLMEKKGLLTNSGA
jgi:glycosyltransferase involved in cell wall biosynthesis